MTDYNSLTVADLKKVLQERSLPTTGKKADLVARLEEHDKASKPATETVKSAAAKPAAATVPGAEDEIDWDDDAPVGGDSSTAAKAKSDTIAASTSKPVAKPAAVTAKQKPATDAPKKTEEQKPAAPAAPVARAGAEADDAQPEPADAEKTEAAPAKDFSIGLSQTDAEKELQKRRDRAKRFGLTKDAASADAIKLLERAKKFGTGATEGVKGLDSALPERPQKRGRGGDKDAENREPKRQRENGDGDGRKGGRAGRGRRGEGRGQREGSGARENDKGKAGRPNTGSVLDDPKERAKAEARAKKFGTVT
jgi:SAP domain-containing ribonucleoprotein